MPKPQFRIATYRFDPYKNFRFKVKWDGVYVAGVNRISVLRRTTQAVRFRSGGDPSTVRVSPGPTEYQPITLEQGVTYDYAFEQWANKVWDYQRSAASGDGTPDVSLKDFRKDITIELCDEAGTKAIAYNVFRCWVSEFQALPELDSLGSAVARSEERV